MANFLYLLLTITSVVSIYSFDLLSDDSDEFENDFLIGLSSGCAGFDRRQLIRESNIELYKHRNPGVTWKFMLLNPNNDTLREQIMQENKTHGDIVILEKFVDSKTNAIWVKPYEWFKFVAANMPKYRYVAKMDDDTFMNITGLYEYVFTDKVKHSNDSIIAMWHIWLNGRIQFPHGGFYALSWDQMIQVNHFYDTIPLNFPDAFEDVQVAIFYMNASKTFTKVDIRRNCNWKNHDRPTGMSKCNLTFQHQNEFSDIIRVHLLKDTDLYKNISSYFIKHERELIMKDMEEQGCNEYDLSDNECDFDTFYKYQSIVSDLKRKEIMEL